MATTTTTYKPVMWNEMPHHGRAGYHRYQQPKQSQQPHGLCDCCFDADVCCCATFCPCVLFGRLVYWLKGESLETAMCNCYCFGYSLWEATLPVFTPCLVYETARVVDKQRVANKSTLQTEPQDGCKLCCTACCCTNCKLAQDYMDAESGVAEQPPEGTSAPTVVNAMMFGIVGLTAVSAVV